MKERTLLKQLQRKNEKAFFFEYTITWKGVLFYDY